MRLISWTLRSVANSLFITGTETTQIWVKELELARRNGPKGNGKAKGLKVVFRQHANCQDKKNLGSKERTKSRVKAPRKLSRQTNLGSKERTKSCVKATRKPSRQTNLGIKERTKSRVKATRKPPRLKKV
jgi:hypothetical protein